MKKIYLSILPILILGLIPIQKKVLFNTNKFEHSINNDELKCAVVFHPSGCDYFICVTAQDDFILMEWYGGNDPEKGDILYGDFQSYGFKNGFNITKKKKMRVWLEDYMLSKDDALEKYSEQCE